MIWFINCDCGLYQEVKKKIRNCPRCKGELIPYRELHGIGKHTEELIFGKGAALKDIENAKLVNISEIRKSSLAQSDLSPSSGHKPE